MNNVYLVTGEEYEIFSVDYNIWPTRVLFEKFLRTANGEPMALLNVIDALEYGGFTFKQLVVGARMAEENLENIKSFPVPINIGGVIDEVEEPFQKESVNFLAIGFLDKIDRLSRSNSDSEGTCGR